VRRAASAIAEQQWKPLVFPTFKASTQHGYKAVLANHVLPAWKEWRLRDIERLAIQQWVAEKFAKRTGWQTVRNSWVLLSGILESAVEYGYLQTNPARGVKFPHKGSEEEAGDHRRDEPSEAARRARRTVSHNGAADRGHGAAHRRAAGVAVFPGAEDHEGVADDSVRFARGRGAVAATVTAVNDSVD
jgi:hypothetical protein